MARNRTENTKEDTLLGFWDNQNYVILRNPSEDVD